MNDDSDIDSFSFSSIEHDENDFASDKTEDHYLEQYRIYLHIFNSTNDRRQHSNEFFLGLNTVIMGILGYVEGKSVASESSILVLVPLVGIGICICWYKIISSYTQINRSKFKVIHKLERKLPVPLFEAEWELLGKGRDARKYIPLSVIEKHIPVIFAILYMIIFIINFPWNYLINLINSLI